MSDRPADPTPDGPGFELPPGLASLGVVVQSLDDAGRAGQEAVESHLGRVVEADDDPGGAIAATVGAAGTYIHVPAGVELTVPIQATAPGRRGALARSERLLLVADEGAIVHVIEGCAAPMYRTDPLRFSVTEVVVGPGAKVTHSAIQNWSTNVEVVAAKAAVVGPGGQMEWIDGNVGGGRVATTLSTRLLGAEASAVVRSLAATDAGQLHELRTRMIHAAHDTSSTVQTKVIADGGGRCHHRSEVQVAATAARATSHVAVDGLVLDGRSTLDAVLDRRVEAAAATIEERTTSAGLDEDELRYLATRGLSGAQAGALLATGLIEPITRRLPLEFAVEWTRLIELRMAGSVG